MKVKVKDITIAVLAIGLVGVIGFGYFYLKRTNPVKVIQDTIPIAAPTSRPPGFRFAIYGDEKSPLKYPMAVTAEGGEIYVSDSDNSRVVVFDNNGGVRRLIGAPKKDGETVTKVLEYPYGLAVQGDRLYVADLGGSRVAVFRRGGEFVEYLKPKPEGAFYKPADLKIVNDKIYLTDVAKMKVLVLDLEGNVILSFGEEGTGAGQLKYPNGVAVDKDGNLYVADSGNSRLQVFDPQGKYLRTLGGPEKEIGTLTTARGIGLDRNGNLYVVCGLLGQVKVLDPQGKELFQVGSRGSGNGQLGLPNGLFIAGNRLLVTEVGNDRVSVFEW